MLTYFAVRRPLEKRTKPNFKDHQEMKTSQKKVGTASSFALLPRASLTVFRAGGKEGEEVFETNWDLEVNKFDDMGLKEEVLRGIYGYGFKDPSPIQQKAILPVIQGKDTIA